ncbi:ribosome hibernation-promoting factor, HPF/YfiA family [Pontibacter sp. G13]|uniref:ribosome hibernation-promoting factor, HPF/YfiA family n=1 Tax=Pontibacter sp. G13 TaxID=3074898 RepID=UPI00288BCA83|nr:ribosome-associated translation inhibitor RaiA [Pontibacter sp. G13]WNJ19235.1 ribosome-associated translation inhibitor RaiA [Pontibacter sp. G13]
MKITIQAIHFTAADHLKDFIQKKCDKLDHFFDRITDGNVILKVQHEENKANKYAEIIVNVPGEKLVAHANGASFEEAVDTVTNKLKEQLRRYKGKMKAHV